jgi:hypothetical protein
MTTAMAAAEVTPQMLANAYIAKDPSDPSKCAVYYAAARGRHPVLAEGFESRGAAERWLDYQRRQTCTT